MSVLDRACFIILNYNNYEKTIQSIRSLKALEVSGAILVVIDNNSNDRSVEFLNEEKKKTNFVLIESSVNGGFAAGNNIGIKYALRKKFDYIIILNNDLQCQEDIFTPMICYLKENPNVAVVGPELWNYKEATNSGNKINYTKITFDNSISSDKSDLIIEADFLIGACLVVKTSAIREVGLMPEVYFLNYEETEWCLAFKQRGFKVQCLRKYKLVHEGGGTIDKYDGMQVYFLRRNIVLFERRNAPLNKKIIFFIKLSVYSLIQCLHEFSLNPIRSYYDGVTEKNRFSYLQ